MPSKLDYRPDIDGLRAIAVLSVLFYHGGIKLFPGGFVGVDVFFVISGYLITSIIIREIKAGEFTLINFYERRIRRIYPALFTVVAFTLLVSALLFDAMDYANIGKSAISVTFFLSNVLFWTESGYFEAPSILKPLLHAWSLSVEEQFYILFPILMALIARFFKSRFGLTLALIATASLALSVYGINHDASAAFYLMQFRAWELLIGSLLALSALPSQIGITLRNILSATGIIMILASVALYNHETPFPGMAALLPVMGSALIIYSGKGGTSLVGNVLSLRPIVFIGQISYSLNLWHWPLLLFGKYYLIREPTAMDLSIWLLVTFTISTLAWKYVENPFRVKTFLIKPRIFVFAGSVMALSLITSAAIYLHDGFPLRFSPEQEFLGRNDPEWRQWQKCTVARENGAPKSIRLCDMGADSSTPEFFLWGDSHARALAPAINASAAQAGVAGRMTAMTSCPPLLGMDRPDERLGVCLQYEEMVLQYIQAHPELKTIILTARWALSAEGSRYKVEEGASVTLVDVVIQNQNDSNAVLFDIGLDRTVAKLIELNRKVVIVSGVPEIGYDVPSSFSIAIRTGRDINNIIAPTFQEYLERNYIVLKTINGLKEKGTIQVVDPAQALCDDIRCNITADGQPLYLDNSHLSPFGAHYISYLFDRLFDEMTSD